MTPAAKTSVPARVRARRLLIVALAGLVLGMGSFLVYGHVTTPRRTTPVYDPPVLAGQWIPGRCSAGFYARLGSTIVLTSSPHCATEGTVAIDPDTGITEGVFGPTAIAPTCPYAGHKCKASDMDYLVVAPDRIPWGHLNVVDLGTAGYRVIPEGTKPLACADVAVGDQVEVDGRGVYRSGTVAEKDQYLYPEDGDFFACMIASYVQVDNGDSGSAVLVRGIPAGVTSRSLGGSLGFTPLSEGLALLGLELCTDPDCGLVPPVASAAAPSGAGS